MTRRVFDVENEKDMADLWDILPDECMRIVTNNGTIEIFHGETILYNKNDFRHVFKHIIKINWHDKTEITRPIKEATEADLGKLCRFWDYDEAYIGILASITNIGHVTYYTMKSPAYNDLNFLHCRRLTKQESEELI